MNLSAAHSVGARIKNIRAQNSQTTMAEELGVSLRTLQNYERDEREVTSDVLKKLYLLGWNTNWILTGQGPERLEGLSNKALGVSDVGADYQSQPLRLNRDILARAARIVDMAVDLSRVTVGQATVVQLVADVYEYLERTEFSENSMVEITRELTDKLFTIQGAGDAKRGSTVGAEHSADDKEISRK